MPIPEPNIKDKLSANMVREILRAIRSLTPISGHGMRISRGPNGTVYNAKTVKANKQAPAVLPWTFRCTVGEDEDGNETRTGGWCNGQAQLGLDAHWFGDYGITRTLSSSGRIEDCDQTDDGKYYLEVKPTAKEMTLKRYGLDAAAPQNDFENDTYYVYVGTVEDAKQTDGIYCVPVIYNYL